MLRWIEAVSGVLASLAGEAALVRLLTIPSYSGAGCHIATPGEPPICVTRTATLLQVNGAAAVVNLGIVAILSLGVGLAAVWHSRTGRRGARTTLWGATAVLALYTILSILSIGALLLPSVAFALVACASSVGHRPTAA
jgi:hypothetical protein